MKRPPFSLAASTLLAISMIAFTVSDLSSQIVLNSLSDPYTQNFNSLGIPTGGAAQTSTLPANWRVDANTSMRTLGTWAGAGTLTTRNGGENLPNTNGIYNFGSPTRVGVDSTDRSIGFYSNGSGTNSGNLYAQFLNQTGADITTIELSYNVENFRDGTVSGGTRFQLYYSLDGSNWTSAGTDFFTLYSGATANTGFDPAPGGSVLVNASLTFSSPIQNGDLFYLAWNYSNATSDSPSIAYALAIDNFSLTIVPEPSAAAMLIFGFGTFFAIRRIRNRP